LGNPAYFGLISSGEAAFACGGVSWREELCWVQLDVVDFSAGVQGMIRVIAKTVQGKSWEPKTKVNRFVPISSKLKIYLEKCPIQGVEGKWYFSTPNGKRWDPDNLSRYLRKTNEELGREWFCLDFRHTFGSQLAMIIINFTYDQSGYFIHSIHNRGEIKWKGNSLY
jgi:integrase